MEAREFRELHPEFEAKGAVVLGVSLDSEAEHRKFREREKIPFDLLADPDGALCRLYRVPVWNFLIARVARRATYVIGRDGRIQEAFAKVRPAGHAAEVLSHL